MMLEVIDLYKNYNEIKALNGVNLTVQKGEKIVIIGPSGCGKSTLLRCINLLEKRNEGIIKYDGKDINDYQLNNLSQKIGMIFQSYNLFNHLSVIDNITLAPIKLKILTKEEAEKNANVLLDKMKLKEKANRYPKELSGGEKQRIAIIRSLILSPELLLIDEPTVSLSTIYAINNKQITIAHAPSLKYIQVNFDLSIYTMTNTSYFHNPATHEKYYPQILHYSRCGIA